jgi:hypothetical protein
MAKSDQPQQCGVVILTPDGEFKTEIFATLDELTARLADLIDKDVSVSCFSGIPLPISKPPFRHLMTPWGNKPLFATPSGELEADETGYLGVDPILVAPPSAIQPPVKSRQVEDEFFDDEVSDTIDVFNRVLPDPDS